MESEDDEVFVKQSRRKPSAVVVLEAPSKPSHASDDGLATILTKLNTLLKVQETFGKRLDTISQAHDVDRGLRAHELEQLQELREIKQLVADDLKTTEEIGRLVAVQKNEKSENTEELRKSLFRVQGELRLREVELTSAMRTHDQLMARHTPTPSADAPAGEPKRITGGFDKLYFRSYKYEGLPIEPKGNDAKLLSAAGDSEQM